VVVAVIAMRMMQVAFHQIIGVIAVRDRFVAAAGAVAMFFVVASAIVARSTCRGICSADGQPVLLDTGFGHMVQMAVMEIVYVSVMFDACVAAIRPVLVSVSLMLSGHSHCSFYFESAHAAAPAAALSA
jgi:hypothetical protein